MNRIALVAIGCLLVPGIAFADTTQEQIKDESRQRMVSTGEVKEEAVEDLNSMLRGELSAVETYTQAIKKVGDEPEGAELRRIRDAHQEAAAKLRSEVIQLGGTPAQDSGAWGTWAKTVEGTAKLFGDVNALRALREGEEHGLEEYQEALSDRDVATVVKTCITEQKLVEKQQQNITALNQWIERASRAN